MKKRQIMFAIVLMLLTLLTAGCSNKTHIFASSPEEMAVRFVQESEEAGFNIVNNSVKVIQTIDHADTTLILVQYDGERQDVGQEKCEMVLEVKHNSIGGWKVNAGVGHCHEIDASEDSTPITVVSSWGYSSLFEDRYSTVFGYVRDPQIVKVVVTWDDGNNQSVEVNMSTYFIVRKGESHMARIAAYNAQNEAVFDENLDLDL